MPEIGEELQIDGFPFQKLYPFIKSSEKNSRYNCIAWALYESNTWYEPRIIGYPYRLKKHLQRWPPEVPNEYTKEAYVNFFEFHGFSKCDDGELEDGYEKVAIFFLGNGMNRPHACRQKPCGLWTSKIGPDEDVIHQMKTLDKGRYGDVVQFLKRRRTEITCMYSPCKKGTEIHGEHK